MRNEKDMPLGVGVLVVKDGKFLCAVRTDNGEVCGPGGHMEQGETPEQAAIRETKEEFGITPKSLKMLGVLGENGDMLPSMIFVCTEYDGEVKADNNEMVQAGFADFAKMQELGIKLFPAFEDSVTLLAQGGGENLDGGKGSGNWGHVGRPGKRGGSGGGGGNTASAGGPVSDVKTLKKGDKVTYTLYDDDIGMGEVGGRNQVRSVATSSSYDGTITDKGDDYVVVSTEIGSVKIKNEDLGDYQTLDKKASEGGRDTSDERIQRIVNNMTPQERDLYNKAHADAEKAIGNLENAYQSSMDAGRQAAKDMYNGKEIQSGLQAAKDHTIPGAKAETQAVYDKMRENEKAITQDMVEIADGNYGVMYGLAYSVKTGKSIQNKIERKRADAQKNGEAFDETKTVAKMGDVVRYTEIVSHNDIAMQSKNMVKQLESKGYTIKEFDNKYQNAKSDYKGVHIGAVAPNGQTIELQIHSSESMHVKEQLHPLYETSRSADTPARVQAVLKMEMHNISTTLQPPAGINDESVKSWKK